MHVRQMLESSVPHDYRSFDPMDLANQIEHTLGVRVLVRGARGLVTQQHFQELWYRLIPDGRSQTSRALKSLASGEHTLWVEVAGARDAYFLQLEVRDVRGRVVRSGGSVRVERSYVALNADGADRPGVYSASESYSLTGAFSKLVRNALR